MLTRSLLLMTGHIGRLVTAPRRSIAFAKSVARHPVTYQAGELHQAVPASSFPELFPETEGLTPRLDDLRLDRHGWNTKLHEEILLSLAVQALKPRQVFEIGTFDGGTTRRLAEAAPPDATVWTIDLAEAEFNATQGPEGFSGDRVGEVYRQSTAADRVKQLRGNSTTYDFSAYFGQIDFAFVDAAHDYPHGLVDSRTALKLVKPGGIIVWHDFEPYWHGLVRAICEATHGLPLRRVSGTSLAALRLPLDEPGEREA